MRKYRRYLRVSVQSLRSFSPSLTFIGALTRTRQFIPIDQQLTIVPEEHGVPTRTDLAGIAWPVIGPPLPLPLRQLLLLLPLPVIVGSHVRKTCKSYSLGIHELISAGWERGTHEKYTSYTMDRTARGIKAKQTKKKKKLHTRNNIEDVAREWRSGHRRSDRREITKGEKEREWKRRQNRRRADRR